MNIIEVNKKNIKKQITKTSNNKIVFEKGIYNFYKEDAENIEVHFSNIDSKTNIEKKIYFNFSDVENIELDGNQSTLILHGDFASFMFNKCKNIKVRNFIIDYNMPTSIEMYVEKIENNTVDFKIPEIYDYVII